MSSMITRRSSGSRVLRPVCRARMKNRTGATKPRRLSSSSVDPERRKHTELQETFHQEEEEQQRGVEEEEEQERREEEEEEEPQQSRWLPMKARMLRPR